MVSHTGRRRGPSINGPHLRLESCDLHGVTGRDIMGHLIAGVRDPKALAQLARARRKIAELEEALEARSSSPPGTPRCRGSCWSASTGVAEEITRLTEAIEQSRAT